MLKKPVQFGRRFPKPNTWSPKISRGEWLPWRRSGFWCLGLAVWGGLWGWRLGPPNWAWESKLGKCRLLEICEDLLGGMPISLANHRQTQGASQSVNTFTVGTVQTRFPRRISIASTCLPCKGCARRISIRHSDWVRYGPMETANREELWLQSRANFTAFWSWADAESAVGSSNLGGHLTWFAQDQLSYVFFA